MHWKRLLVPAVVVGAFAASAAPASAATVIGSPSVSPDGGIYTVGTPVTFTFSENVGSTTPVAYQYTLNGGATQTVPAPSGTATSGIIPTRYSDQLVAYAVAADGTVSGGSVVDFNARAATPAADKDLNGDGVPDLLTVGGTGGLAPGLWQATGRPAAGGHAGQVNVPATDIGVYGNGFDPGTGSPADFDGAQAITGDFFGTGFQDVLIYYNSGTFAGEGAVLAGQGDGSALQPISGSECNIMSGILTDFHGDNPLQLANAYANVDGDGLTDLLAVSGDSVNGYSLDYYTSDFVDCGFSEAFAGTNVTPDGTADWNKWTISALNDASGTGMFLWNKSTGALYLWQGVTAHDNGDLTGTFSYTQYLISPHWNRGKSLTTLEAADLNGDGVPDLWAVNAGGIARAYIISDLSGTGRAKIAPQPPQKLS